MQGKSGMQSLKNNKPAALLIIIGSLVWSLTMVKSGLCWDAKCVGGIGFWGPNGHDGVWHIALINHLANDSLEMPVFSGSDLKNYHIGFDLLLSLFVRFFHIPAQTLYFQIIPPIVAVLIGFLTYLFVERWTKSKKGAFWATFFVYFGGSFSPIVSLIRDGHIGGESTFWSQQAISTLINPPFALSLVALLVILLILLKYEEKKTWKKFAVLVLLIAITTQIKVYAGILTISALLAVGLYDLVLKKNTSYLALATTSLVISLLLFIPLNKNSSSLVVFQPFWFLETMMALSDRLGWPRYYEAMTNYKAGGNFVKGVPAYIVAFIIFWAGNMGTRIVAGTENFRWIKSWNKLSPIKVFMVVLTTEALTAPMLFLQKGTPWNTIQFFYYYLFFASIIAGIAFENLIKDKSHQVRIILVCALLVLTLPTTYATLQHYLPSRPPARLPNDEIEALKFLSKNERGVVLTYPFDSYAAEQAVVNPPRPLYLYESTAYVAAFSGKPTFLEDEINLNITDYEWRARRKEVEEWLKNLDQKETYAFLRKNNIKYVYWVKGQRASLGETQLGISRIFENKSVDIYQVD